MEEIEMNMHAIVRKAYYEYKRIAAGVSRPSPSKCKKELAIDQHEEFFSLDESTFAATAKKYYYEVAKYRRNLPGESINDNYYKCPIQDNLIVLVGLGKNVRGNMQYILNELNYSPDFEGYEIYVRTAPETDEIVKTFIIQNKWTRTKTILDNKKYGELMESAHYLLTEVFFPEDWVKKEGQVYINIWHGTPLKTLGLAKKFKNAHRNGTTQKNFIDADYLLYPNEYTKEKMLDSYKVTQLMDGSSLMLGYPRTGGMLAASTMNPDQLRAKIAPNNEKIYVFMPTFRDHLSLEEGIAQSQELLCYLDSTLRDDQILYVNLHHRLNDSIDYSVYHHIKQFPKDVDSYHLMAASDAMISDYSSVFLDYLALRRQIILYVPDYEEYVTQRGMYLDLLKLPFDIARTPEDVLHALNTGKQYDDTEVFENFCKYDSSENAAKLCRIISGKTQELSLEAIPKNQKTKVFVYSYAMKSGPETELLHAFTRLYDHDKHEVYLGCDMAKTNANRNACYPMMFETPVIGSLSDPHISSIGKVVRELYQQKKLTFAQAIGYLKYDYALVPKRMYGKANFDSIVLFDADNPEMMIALTQTPQPKILFLNTRILNQIDSGNEFLKDAVKYAAKYAKQVCVHNLSDKKRAESLLGSYWKENITLVDTAEKMDHVIFQQ